MVERVDKEMEGCDPLTKELRVRLKCSYCFLDHRRRARLSEISAGG